MIIAVSIPVLRIFRIDKSRPTYNQANEADQGQVLTNIPEISELRTSVQEFHENGSYSRMKSEPRVQFSEFTK